MACKLTMRRTYSTIWCTQTVMHPWTLHFIMESPAWISTSDTPVLHIHACKSNVRVFRTCHTWESESRVSSICRVGHSSGVEVEDSECGSTEGWVAWAPPVAGEGLSTWTEDVNTQNSESLSGSLALGAGENGGILKLLSSASRVALSSNLSSSASDSERTWSEISSGSGSQHSGSDSAFIGLLWLVFL